MAPSTPWATSISSSLVSAHKDHCYFLHTKARLEGAPLQLGTVFGFAIIHREAARHEDRLYRRADDRRDCAQD